MIDQPRYKVISKPHEFTIWLDGEKIAVAWGPAADSSGNWFAMRVGEEPLRLPDEDQAKMYASAVMNESAER